MNKNSGSADRGVDEMSDTVGIVMRNHRDCSLENNGDKVS